MKNIKEYIAEKQDWWTGEDAKLISKNDLIKFGKEALKQTKLNARQLQDEISQYKDPDDLDDAYGREALDYCKFENVLANLIADDNKYGGKEGDITERIWFHMDDFLEALQ